MFKCKPFSTVWLHACMASQSIYQILPRKILNFVGNTSSNHKSINLRSIDLSSDVATKHADPLTSTDLCSCKVTLGCQQVCTVCIQYDVKLMISSLSVWVVDSCNKISDEIKNNRLATKSTKSRSKMVQMVQIARIAPSPITVGQLHL